MWRFEMSEIEKGKVTGIMHVGIGVRDVDVSLKFYRDVLGLTKLYADFGTLYNVMPDFFRTSPHILKGWMYQRQVKGIIVECIQRLTPTPRPIHKDVLYGDIGVNKMIIEVADVEKFSLEFRDRIKFLTKPQSVTLPEWGDYNFVYGADPDGCLLEFISSSKLKVDGPIGSIRSLGISVTDLDRSLAWYQKYLGYDTVLIKPHEAFSGLMGDISGSRDTKVRSCLLASSNGYFPLELYEVSNPRGRSIPLDAVWGDYGYLEAGHCCPDILLQARYYTNMGIEFICAPSPVYIENEEYKGLIWFMYIRDPDGIPVEFIQE
jgi:catechol 2,3-dioxygenase-like lactoylglutathione lyase family enzyme